MEGITRTEKNTKLLASLRLRCSLEQKSQGLSPIGMTIPGDGLQIGSPGLEVSIKKKRKLKKKKMKKITSSYVIDSGVQLG